MTAPGHSAKRTAAVRQARGRPARIPRLLIAVVLLLLIAALVFRFAGGSALRGWAESTLNENLTGYTVRLPDLRIDVIGLGLQLLDLTITQDENPKPAVAQIDRLGLTVSWAAILRGDLLAQLEIDSPRLHFERRQAAEEAGDRRDLEDRGWQEALFEIYPMEINQLAVSDGSITYVEKRGKQPMRLDDLELTARNIRNVRSNDAQYPSPLQITASVFESGVLRVDGNVDFLAEPYPAADVDIQLADIPLDAMDPLASEVAVDLNGGVLGVDGHVEYGPHTKDVYLSRVRIDSVELEYRAAGADEQKIARRAELAAEASETLSKEEATRVYLDLLEIRGAGLAYHQMDRDYRVFVSDADVTIEDVVNREPEKRAALNADGRFMGAGPISLRGSYRAGQQTPDFDIDLRIERTPLSELNDVFRSYGNFDVSEGTFAFYSELTADEGRLSGYVKPILEEMDVFDREQDRDKPALREVYEGLVGAVATLLQNSSDDVAARVDVSGRIDDPAVSTWDAVISLISNAFIEAIAPGIEDAARSAE